MLNVKGAKVQVNPVVHMALKTEFNKRAALKVKLQETIHIFHLYRRLDNLFLYDKFVIFKSKYKN